MPNWNKEILKAHIISTGLLYILVGLSACTPRDVRVSSDGQKTKFEDRKGDDAKKAPNKDELLLATHLVERQAEALQILSWVADPASFNKNADATLQVVESGVQNNQWTQYFIFNSTQQKSQSTTATLTGSLQAQVTVSGTAEAPELQKIEVSSVGFAIYLQSQKDSVQVKDDKRQLVVTPAKDAAGEYDIFYTTETHLKVNKAGNSEERTLYPMVLMRARIDWKTKSIELLNSSGSIRNYDRYMIENISSQDLKITFDSCVKISGLVKAQGKSTVDLKVGEDAFSVEGWSSSNAACAERPVVDLNRFLQNY
jgi:hypothetical protein